MVDIYPMGVYYFTAEDTPEGYIGGIDMRETRPILDGQAETAGNCCGARHKVRTPEEQRTLLNRLRKIEGQIRGIGKMVENNAYCPEILVQVSAATSALNSFNKTLLACHIRSCVAGDIRDGKDDAIDELCDVLQKLMK